MQRCDLTGKGKQYVGTLYIGGTHPAGNGGAWMSAVFGLCGIRCLGNTISINPHLPAHWEEVVIPFGLLGQKLKVTLTHESIRVHSLQPPDVPLIVSVGDRFYPLNTIDEISIPIP